MRDVQSKFRPTLMVPSLALGLACLGAASMLYYHLRLFIPRAAAVQKAEGLAGGYSFGNDLYQIWITTREWLQHGRNPYSPEMTREIQTGIFGRPLDRHNKYDPSTDYRQYAYPAFTDFLFLPSALLDFRTLRLLLVLLLPVLTAVSIWMWVRALGWDLHPMWLAVIITLTLGTYQLLEAFFALQPGLFVGFFLSGAALAICHKRLALAGSLCGLTLIKPHVTALAIFYLLLWSISDRARARFWLSFLIVTIALLLPSLLLWPHWIGEWVSVLLAYHHYAMPPLTNVLLGSGVPMIAGPLIIALILAAGVAVAWRNRRAAPESPAFWFTLSLLLGITTITLLPGQAVYDHLILLPGVLWLAQHREQYSIAGPGPRLLLVIGGMLLCWSWIASLLLVVLHPFLPDAVFYRTSIFALPIRNAAPLPVAIVAALAWGYAVNPLKQMTSWSNSLQ